MIEKSVLLEISNLVRVVGVCYVPAIVIATSGLFPGFGRSLASKLKYGQAAARIRQQRFGWGAESFSDESDEEVKAKHVVLVLLIVVPVSAILLYGLDWAERLQIPALNIAVGSGFFLFGLFLRRQFLVDWEGSPRKLDFACFLIGLLFVFTQSY
ncbi:hypothetical protein [uncultured Ruegeria sp.]|uniref:hypothetical protein n=1 Tax=uncultured Ruegeria sp. TaxID=259304 RepID=UPI00260BCA85|nr:hypothetical protein [uncultured Ruegeria sp.]